MMVFRDGGLFSIFFFFLFSNIPSWSMYLSKNWGGTLYEFQFYERKKTRYIIRSRLNVITLLWFSLARWQLGKGKTKKIWKFERKKNLLSVNNVCASFWNFHTVWLIGGVSVVDFWKTERYFFKFTYTYLEFFKGMITYLKFKSILLKYLKFYSILLSYIRLYRPRYRVG